jgi:hypothetical protein
LLIGRETYFDESALFLKQYILHRTGIRRIRKITCTGLRSEGAGSQALMLMNAINFSRFFGLEYLHTPFNCIAHPERPMEEWAAAWEALFNLGAGENKCDARTNDVVNFSHNFMELNLCYPWQQRRDELAENYGAMIPGLRRKYYSNKSSRTTQELTVAVHIRRGDVSAADPDYFTSNEAILRTLRGVKSILDARTLQYKLRVYSQGSTSDFADLSLPEVEFYLNVDALWTMQELIEADMLVMAKGCFSFCAALISDGIKLFQPIAPSGNDFLPSWKWRSAPLAPDWIPCTEDGTFDAEPFVRQLSLTLSAKSATASERSSVHEASD